MRTERSKKVERIEMESGEEEEFKHGILFESFLSFKHTFPFFYFPSTHYFSVLSFNITVLG